MSKPKIGFRARLSISIRGYEVDPAWRRFLMETVEGATMLQTMPIRFFPIRP